MKNIDRIQLADIKELAFWFEYEVVDVNKYHVQIKRGNKVIIDVNLEKL